MAGMVVQQLLQLACVSLTMCLCNSLILDGTSVCQDTINNCTLFDQTMCTDVIYGPWAHAHCALHCGFCTPDHPTPCVDTIGNCHEFDDGQLCSNPGVYAWAYTRCKHYCGFGHCSGNK